MSAVRTIEDRDFLKGQAVEIDRLIALSGSHPLNGPQLLSRRAEIEAELSRGFENLSATPSVRIYFTGKPVIGSEGIDAKFAAESIRIAQEMVSSQYAVNKHGQVGQRGVARDESEAKLLLTGLPRGSFGLELSKPHMNDFVAANQLQSALDQITHLIDASGESDAAFDNAIEGVPWRVIDRLKDFLTTAAKHGAGIRITTPKKETILREPAVETAAKRVGATSHQEGVVEILGVFRGARLETWQFDFAPKDAPVISGRIADDITENDVIQWDKNWINKPAFWTFGWSRVRTLSGKEKSTFELKGLPKEP